MTQCQARFYLTDQVDSVKVVVDDNGLAVARMEYLPYGEEWFTENAADSLEEHLPKYNSQEYDKETGYYYYNARHYDPVVSRFVTPDTVIDGEYLAFGWNRFSYVKGNPVIYKDPTGHNVVQGGLHLLRRIAYSPLGQKIIRGTVRGTVAAAKYTGRFVKSGLRYGKDLAIATKNRLAADACATGRMFQRGYNALKNLGAGKGVDIALGLTRTKDEVGVLVKFANKVKAVTFGSWPSVGLTHGKPGHFASQFFKAAEKARKIKFNLTGMGKIRDILKKGKEGFKAFNMTNAEFYNIANNTKLLGKTVFYRGGKNVTKQILKEIAKVGKK